MHIHTSKKLGVFIFFLLLVLLLPPKSQVYAKDYKDEKSGYDIIFVLDVSGSMITTDKNRNSIEIIKMIIDMCTIGNTRIGFIGYNDTITSSFSLADVSNKALRNDLKKVINNTKFFGYSDMGLGLRHSLDLFSESEDIGNQPIVILLSDGETDLSGSKTGRTNANSNADITDSIALAKDKNIPIYTIGLANDFNTSLDYLKDISDQTDALSYTATSPYQLVDIFNGILSENMNSVLSSAKNLTATGDTQYLDIDVTNESLSELNIILFSDSDLKVDKVLSSTKDVAKIGSSSYQLIKITDPIMETIRITLEGEKDSVIRVSTLGVYSFSDILSLEESTPKKKESNFTLQFYDELNKTEVTDKKLYSSLSLDFYIKDLKTGTETKYPATSTDNGFSFSNTFEQPGNYELRAEYSGESFFGSTKSYPFEVINTPPQKISDLKETVAKQKGSHTYDINNLFTDSDGDSLTYALLSMEGVNIKATLSSNELTITPTTYGDSKISIEASDIDGETCTAFVTIHSIPIWKYYHKETVIIIISVILLITAIVSFFVFRYFRKRNKMPKPSFTGYLVGYFLNMKNSEEVPPLKWKLEEYPNKGLSLSKLLKARSIEANLSGAEKIWISPKVGNSIELIHNSNGTILVGSQTIAKNTPVMVHYGDKIYIAFEDMESELELRYKNS